jgi:hypothetical protein
LRRDLVGARDHEHICTLQGAARFAGTTGRQESTRPRAQGIQEHNVELAGEAAMLETVVEDSAIRGVRYAGRDGTGHAIGIDDDGGVRQGVAELEDFVRDGAGAAL